MRLRTKQILDYHLCTNPSALSLYYGPNTTITLPDRRVYKRVTSSATVDGVLVLSVFGSATERWQIVYDGSPLSVQFWGALGDGTTDDTTAITNALNSVAPAISFPKTTGYFKITNVVIVSNQNVKRIFCDGATILNTDLSKQSFYFQDCQNVSIYGGLWGQLTMPTANSGGGQHIFQFNRCVNTSLDSLTIDKSGEMGIAFTSCNIYSVFRSSISHTMRDGVYSRYSANGTVTYCKFSNIKDDAISFHDKDNANAGVDSEKTNTLVNIYGYSQASNFTAAFNTIDNAYQGIVSIAGANVEVFRNTINNTVLSAICIYNQKNDDPAGVYNATINSNKITKACSTTTINGTAYDNNGQSGPGRAAIFVGSTGTNNQVNQGETKLLYYVTVVNNTVFNSGANGFWSNLTDHLKYGYNTVLNCAGAGGALDGITVQIQNVTNLNAVGNCVHDTRSTPQHVYPYQLFNVTGYSDVWDVKGYLTANQLIHGTTVLANTNVKRKVTEYTANYTLTLDDMGQTIVVSAPGVTITIPQNLPVGWWCNIWNNYNVPGTTQISPASGVTLNYNTSNNKVAGAFGRARLECTYTNWFSLGGDVPKSTDLQTGSATQSGNGTATGFAFPHGLTSQPSFISVSAGSSDADSSNIKYITSDATSIVVTYKVAPPSGTNNLTWYWSAKK